MVFLGFILSLAIGLALGLLGGGGSILTMPVIHYVFGVAAHDAIAMSLAIVGITSMVALIPHARGGRVHWRVGIAFGATSMVAAFFGGRVGASLPGPALIVAFAVVMIVAGIVMLARTRRPARSCNRPVGLLRVLAVGLGVGLVTGTLGAGGGFVIVPALTLFGGLAMHEAVATSLLIIALNSTAGVAGTMHHASFHPPLTLAVTAFAIIGSFLGTYINRRVSAPRLQRAFGWCVIAVGVAVVIAEVR